MPEYRYPAYRTYQVDGGKPLVLFSAPAVDIDKWAGVPQRLRVEGHENIGFQRDKTDDRVEEIAAFFSDPRNVVQNPLLAAQQDLANVSFESGEGGNEQAQFGDIVIRTDGLREQTMLELLQGLAAHLRNRFPHLADRTPDDERIADLVAQVQSNYGHRLPSEAGDSTLEGEDPDDSQDDDDREAVGQGSGTDTGPNWNAATILSESTNLTDFYLEVLARLEVLRRTGLDGADDELLGFHREAVLAYLLPVVLVDGQHRLRGAVQAARVKANDNANQDRALTLVDEGVASANADEMILREQARRLPVSLLMDHKPAEHVFQFVVVNQKATPLSDALLGTIVATSLGDHEVEEIGQRLRDAKIKFDDSRAIAYLTRDPNSPFYGLVKTGVNDDRNVPLQWNVLRGLIRIFRDLTGGRQYGLKNDHATLWCKKCLPQSEYVAGATTQRERKKIWGASEGPWLEVFTHFYTRVRDDFADEDPAAPNAWGSTRDSNLYNKVSLTILAADFFKFLHIAKRTLSSREDVDAAFNDWISPEKGRKYFNRRWEFNGYKKDNDRVKKELATLWFEYRENPDRLPPLSNFQF